jgi:hypothetical protein
MERARRSHLRMARGRLPVGSVLLAVLVPLMAMALSVSGAPAPAAARRITAAEAERQGLALGVVARSVLGESLLTANLPEADASVDPRGLLDAAAGGGLVAAADRIGPKATELIVADTDGGQLRVPMSGLIGATFAPDGTWLAVIDGGGALLRVSSADGATRQLADGPFLGHPVVASGGDVLLLAVASVEAPYRSQLVRVTPDGEVGDPLTEDELVYGASLLDDGSVAVIAHTPAGSRVTRLIDGAAATLATLEPGAIHAVVSGDGSQIAWEAEGDIYLRGPNGKVTHLGPGSRPRFAPDGRAILVDRGSAPGLIDLRSGRFTAVDATAAAFVPCGAGCRP